MSEHLVIKDVGKTKDINDLEFLKDAGIQILQDFSGKVWTDFNIHDPGVTILEVLCFALTELGYRTDYDLVDILAYDNSVTESNDTFFEPKEILSSGTVTFNDLKKLILDLGTVKNVEFFNSEAEADFKGIYEVGVELLDSTISEESKEAIQKDIRKILVAERNISNAFGKIDFLEFDEITFNVEIEVSERVSNYEFVHAAVNKIEDYLSPLPRFISLDEMLENGHRIDQIFNGPNMVHGFIADREIQNHELKKTVYISDLISSLMNLKEAKLIKRIDVVDSKDEIYQWLYTVKHGRVACINYEKSNLSIFYNGGVIYTTDLKSYGSRYSQKKISDARHKENDIKQSRGTKINLKEYHTIQNNFPQNYGIGYAGVPVGSNIQRSAYAKQLKSYLTIFDQILANYFAQLDNVKNLFSTKEISTTLNTQLVSNIPGEEYIFRTFVEEYIQTNFKLDDPVDIRNKWKEFLERKKEQLEAFVQLAVEDEQKFLERRNLVLDHLIARFGMEVLPFDYVSQFDLKELLAYKLDLLRNIPAISKEKHRGGVVENYLTAEGIPMVGIESLMKYHLGFSSSNKRHLTSFVNESLRQLEDESDGNDLTIEIQAKSESEAIKNLLFNGKHIESYRINSKGILTLKMADNSELIVNGKYTKDNYQDFLKVLCKKLKSIDRSSEGIHIVEHINLRPDSEMKCFGFRGKVNGIDVWESSNELDRLSRNKMIDEFLACKAHRPRMLIHEKGLKQFVVNWKGSNFTLNGLTYYPSKDDAENAIDQFERNLDSTSKIENIYLTTKYSSYYENLDDPFSYIISVVLPTWPSRFQQKAFVKYIQELVAQEMPAHCVTNIHWLDFEEMRSFEDSYHSFLSAKESGTSTERVQELDKFLHSILSL